jgi:Holliday junction resolvase RusA-like endonuclease
MTTIIVIGSPAAQGSKSFKGIRGGKAIMTESSKALKPWRTAVTYAALATREQVYGPVSVEMIFTILKPKSAPKSRVTYPDRRPDLDKLIRGVSDGLTDAGVWEDDSRVIRLTASKVYPNESKDALHVPGCVIRIEAVTAVIDEAKRRGVL